MGKRKGRAFEPAPVYRSYDPDKLDGVLVDLDGTVALATSGRYTHEYERVGEDTPHYPVIELLEFMNRGTKGSVDFVFLTGRPERAREQTHAWINTFMAYFLGKDNFTLFMRVDGDHRPDYIVKAEYLERYIFPSWNVLWAFEDRSRVVKMLRDRGVPTLQVKDGDF